MYMCCVEEQKNPPQQTEGGLTLGHVAQGADDQDCGEDCGASDSGQEVLHSATSSPVRALRT